jgi:hypothetical protein
MLTQQLTQRYKTRYDAFSDRHRAPLRRKCDIFSNDLINLAIALIGRAGSACAGRAAATSAALAERGK